MTADKPAASGTSQATANSAGNSAGWIAFAHNKCIAAGAPRTVAAAVKNYVDQHEHAVLIFDAQSSAPVEIDLRGALSTVLKRLPPQPQAESAQDQADTAAAPASDRSAPGRPKLGVIAREVTLLPRHWEWLATQPGGASVALRKLVEEARRSSADADRVRRARESAYRFMHALAGDNPRFEEASRALFAGDLERLRAAINKWPRDVRNHALVLAEASA